MVGNRDYLIPSPPVEAGTNRSAAPPQRRSPRCEHQDYCALPNQYLQTQIARLARSQL